MNLLKEQTNAAVKDIGRGGVVASPNPRDPKGQPYNLSTQVGTVSIPQYQQFDLKYGVPGQQISFDQVHQMVQEKIRKTDQQYQGKLPQFEIPEELADLFQFEYDTTNKTISRNIPEHVINAFNRIQANQWYDLSPQGYINIPFLQYDNDEHVFRFNEGGMFENTDELFQYNTFSSQYYDIKYQLGEVTATTGQQNAKKGQILVKFKGEEQYNAFNSFDELQQEIQSRTSGQNSLSADIEDIQYNIKLRITHKISGKSIEVTMPFSSLVNNENVVKGVLDWDLQRYNDIESTNQSLSNVFGQYDTAYSTIVDQKVQPAEGQTIDDVIKFRYPDLADQNVRHVPLIKSNVGDQFNFPKEQVVRELQQNIDKQVQEQPNLQIVMQPYFDASILGADKQQEYIDTQQEQIVQKLSEGKAVRIIDFTDDKELLTQPLQDRQLLQSRQGFKLPHSVQMEQLANKITKRLMNQSSNQQINRIIKLGNQTINLLDYSDNQTGLYNKILEYLYSSTVYLDTSTLGEFNDFIKTIQISNNVEQTVEKQSRAGTNELVLSLMRQHMVDYVGRNQTTQLQGTQQKPIALSHLMQIAGNRSTLLQPINYLYTQQYAKKMNVVDVYEQDFANQLMDMIHRINQQGTLEQGIKTTVPRQTNVTDNAKNIRNLIADIQQFTSDEQREKQILSLREQIQPFLADTSEATTDIQGAVQGRLYEILRDKDKINVDELNQTIRKMSEQKTRLDQLKELIEFGHLKSTETGNNIEYIQPTMQQRKQYIDEFNKTFKEYTENLKTVHTTFINQLSEQYNEVNRTNLNTFQIELQSVENMRIAIDAMFDDEEISKIARIQSIESLLNKNQSELEDMFKNVTNTNLTDDQFRQQFSDWLDDIFTKYINPISVNNSSMHKIGLTAGEFAPFEQDILQEQIKLSSTNIENTTNKAGQVYTTIDEIIQRRLFNIQYGLGDYHTAQEFAMQLQRTNIIGQQWNQQEDYIRWFNNNIMRANRRQVVNSDPNQFNYTLKEIRDQFIAYANDYNKTAATQDQQTEFYNQIIEFFGPIRKSVQDAIKENQKELIGEFDSTVKVNGVELYTIMQNVNNEPKQISQLNLVKQFFQSQFQPMQIEAGERRQPVDLLKPIRNIINLFNRDTRRDPSIVSVSKSNAQGFGLKMVLKMQYYLSKQLDDRASVASNNQQSKSTLNQTVINLDAQDLLSGRSISFLRTLTTGLDLTGTQDNLTGQLTEDRDRMLMQLLYKMQFTNNENEGAQRDYTIKQIMDLANVLTGDTKDKQLSMQNLFEVSQLKMPQFSARQQKETINTLSGVLNILNQSINDKDKANTLSYLVQEISKKIGPLDKIDFADWQMQGSTKKQEYVGSGQLEDILRYYGKDEQPISQHMLGVKYSSLLVGRRDIQELLTSQAQNGFGNPLSVNMLIEMQELTERKPLRNGRTVTRDLSGFSLEQILAARMELLTAGEQSGTSSIMRQIFGTLGYDQEKSAYNIETARSLSIQNVIQKLEQTHKDILLNLQENIRIGNVADLYNLDYNKFISEDTLHDIVGDVLKLTHGLDIVEEVNGTEVHHNVYDIMQQLEQQLNQQPGNQQRITNVLDSLRRITAEQEQQVKEYVGQGSQLTEVINTTSTRLIDKLNILINNITTPTTGGTQSRILDFKPSAHLTNQNGSIVTIQNQLSKIDSNKNGEVWHSATLISQLFDKEMASKQGIKEGPIGPIQKGQKENLIETLNKIVFAGNADMAKKQANITQRASDYILQYLLKDDITTIERTLGGVDLQNLSPMERINYTMKLFNNLSSANADEMQGIIQKQYKTALEEYRNNQNEKMFSSFNESLNNQQIDIQTLNNQIDTIMDDGSTARLKLGESLNDFRKLKQNNILEILFAKYDEQNKQIQSGTVHQEDIYQELKVMNDSIDQYTKGGEKELPLNKKRALRKLFQPFMTSENNTLEDAEKQYLDISKGEIDVQRANYDSTGTVDLKAVTHPFTTISDLFRFTFQRLFNQDMRSATTGQPYNEYVSIEQQLFNNNEGETLGGQLAKIEPIVERTERDQGELTLSEKIGNEISDIRLRSTRQFIDMPSVYQTYNFLSNVKPQEEMAQAALDKQLESYFQQQGSYYTYRNQLTRLVTGTESEQESSFINLYTALRQNNVNPVLEEAINFLSTNQNLDESLRIDLQNDSPLVQQVKLVKYQIGGISVDNQGNIVMLPDTEQFNGTPTQQILNNIDIRMQEVAKDVEKLLTDVEGNVANMKIEDQIRMQTQYIGRDNSPIHRLVSSMGQNVTSENGVVQTLNKIRQALSDTNVSVNGSLFESQLDIDTTIENVRQFITDTALVNSVDEQGNQTTNEPLYQRLERMLSTRMPGNEQYTLDTMPGHQVLNKLISSGTRINIDNGIYETMSLDAGGKLVFTIQADERQTTLKGNILGVNADKIIRDTQTSISNKFMAVQVEDYLNKLFQEIQEATNAGRTVDIKQNVSAHLVSLISDNIDQNSGKLLDKGYSRQQLTRLYDVVNTILDDYRANPELRRNMKNLPDASQFSRQVEQIMNELTNYVNNSDVMKITDYATVDKDTAQQFIDRIADSIVKLNELIGSNIKIGGKQATLADTSNILSNIENIMEQLRQSSYIISKSRYFTTNVGDKAQQVLEHVDTIQRAVILKNIFEFNDVTQQDMSQFNKYLTIQFSSLEQSTQEEGQQAQSTIAQFIFVQSKQSRFSTKDNEQLYKQINDYLTLVDNYMRNANDSTLQDLQQFQSSSNFIQLERQINDLFDTSTTEGKLQNQIVELMTQSRESQARATGTKDQSVGKIISMITAGSHNSQQDTVTISDLISNLVSYFQTSVNSNLYTARQSLQFDTPQNFDKLVINALAQYQRVRWISDTLQNTLHDGSNIVKQMEDTVNQMLRQIGERYVTDVQNIVERGTADVHQIIRHQITQQANQYSQIMFNEIQKNNPQLTGITVNRQQQFDAFNEAQQEDNVKAVVRQVLGIPGDINDTTRAIDFDQYDENMFRQLMIMMQEENAMHDRNYKWATKMRDEVYTTNSLKYLGLGQQQGVFSRSIHNQYLAQQSTFNSDARAQILGGQYKYATQDLLEKTTYIYNQFKDDEQLTQILSGLKNVDDINQLYYTLKQLNRNESDQFQDYLKRMQPQNLDDLVTQIQLFQDQYAEIMADKQNKGQTIINRIVRNISERINSGQKNITANDNIFNYIQTVINEETNGLVRLYNYNGKDLEPLSGAVLTDEQVHQILPYINDVTLLDTRETILGSDVQRTAIGGILRRIMNGVNKTISFITKVATGEDIFKSSTPYFNDQLNKLELQDTTRDAAQPIARVTSSVQGAPVVQSPEIVTRINSRPSTDSKIEELNQQLNELNSKYYELAKSKSEMLKNLSNTIQELQQKLQQQQNETTNVATTQTQTPQQPADTQSTIDQLNKKLQDLQQQIDEQNKEQKNLLEQIEQINQTIAQERQQRQQQEEQAKKQEQEQRKQTTRAAAERSSSADTSKWTSTSTKAGDQQSDTSDTYKLLNKIREDQQEDQSFGQKFERVMGDIGKAIRSHPVMQASIGSAVQSLQIVGAIIRKKHEDEVQDVKEELVYRDYKQLPPVIPNEYPEKYRRK